MINLMESFKQDVSQKLEGPEEDLQAPNARVNKRTDANGIKSSLIFIGFVIGQK